MPLTPIYTKDLKHTTKPTLNINKIPKYVIMLRNKKN